MIIKTTQSKSIALSSCPEHTIIIKINKDGTFNECFNGHGHIIWDTFAGKSMPKNGQYQMSKNKQLNQDSYQDMLAIVQSFHDKHDFKNKGGEDLHYRIALMAEELGEISSCITKGNSIEDLSEEVADLFILLIGTAISANFNLNQAFWNKMEKLMQRKARMINGKIRVSEFRGVTTPKVRH